MPLEPFYTNRVQREESEPRENRLQQIEYYLERLGEYFSAAISTSAGPELRFPEGLIVEGDEDVTGVSSEAEADTLDPTIPYQIIDTTGGPQVRRMPKAVDAVGPISVKRIGPHLATIYAQAGESIDGDRSVVLARDKAAVKLVSDSEEEWRLFGMYVPAEDTKAVLLLLLVELRKQTLHLTSLSGEDVTDADAEPIEE